ncbi:hypothetical protein [Acuticoccus yangtzensis]|uniref:hypothetical protein n=1 Tax=Acuticoccus yangtzensis TaxID=1443441 RepID=UPI00094973EB|nr:hypothetical protein [Acuticoccus yangtzensis]ORE96264.1 hypothetical protein ATO13_05360 [Stappia sp. 22II-S9-Z10]
MSFGVRFTFWLAGAAVVGLVAGCMSGKEDLGRDAFVGDWRCGETEVVLTSQAVTVGEDSRKIAWIETGGNADYGLFTTDGGHYSVFETTRRSLTLHDHKGGNSMACRRT